MTRRKIKFSTDYFDVTPEGTEMIIEAKNVDVTDIIDADMVLEEIDHGDLLDGMDVDFVADWLRGEGYKVEEDE